MNRLKRIFWTILALAFLSLSWLWDWLGPLVQRFIDLLPLERLKQAVIRFMDRLPPYPTLVVFLIPIVVIEPLKILALWILARGQILLGIASYAGAELLRFGLVAFLFRSCRDKLLSIGWFAVAYGWFVAAHEWAHRQVAPFLAGVRKWLRDAGLIGGERGFLSRLRALWRYSRRGRASSN